MSYRFQAEIRAEHIRALAHLAAQEDVRYYLNGVQLVAAPEVLLVATTGFAIGCLRTQQLASAQFEVLIPNATVKAMGKVKGPVVIGSDDGQSWTLKAGALSLGWKTENGVFPDFRRAIPATTTGEPAQFDARQVALFWKTAKELSADRVGVHSVLLGQNGQGIALVSLPSAPDFIGALSPLSDGDKFPKALRSAPSWVKDAPYVPAKWREAAEEPCDLA